MARARALVRDAIAADDRPLLVALSGGADSLALAAVTAFVARKSSRTARAVVIDHGLQPGSDRIAAHAAEQAERLGLASRVVAVDVAAADEGIESAARRVRYAALEADAAVDDALVLLAHTLDDQAETVLLGLGRGSGPRSIAGMPARDGRWVRPFLRLRRAETESICRAHELTWWDDPHNLDPRFRRVRIRQELLPLMDDVLGGGVAAALARTADLVRADTEMLDVLAERAHTDDAEALRAMPAALRLRVLRRLALGGGAAAGELSAEHLARVDELVTDWRGQQRVELPGHVSVVRSGNRLRCIRTPVAG
ncbi:tRNA lysidine(34) synthetase TilS [Aeromicrobium phragmitis]|uniref:tRNA lysidine(34) synthetase TilS n=1 Tax=Aeromicrobium phragmitis TaxID=2478914 RepID=UPI001FB84581|nr:tRNA lysidine(34) synthetase TilS [Aeromicrobium phragmitis]